MANTSLDQQIRARIEAFLDEVASLVRASALESVQEALGGEASTFRRRGPGRPRGSGRRGPGRPRGAMRPARRAVGRAGKRVRRSSEDLEKLGARVLAQVRTKQGQRLEEIGRAMKTETGVLKRPIALLLASKKLSTKGQKRGTRYFSR